MNAGKQQEGAETLTLIPQRPKLAVLLPDMWSQSVPQAGLSVHSPLAIKTAKGVAKSRTTFLQCDHIGRVARDQGMSPLEVR